MMYKAAVVAAMVAASASVAQAAEPNYIAAYLSIGTSPETSACPVANDGGTLSSASYLVSSFSDRPVANFFLMTDNCLPLYLPTNAENSPTQNFQTALYSSYKITTLSENDYTFQYFCQPGCGSCAISVNLTRFDCDAARDRQSASGRQAVIALGKKYTLTELLTAIRAGAPQRQAAFGAANIVTDYVFVRNPMVAGNLECNMSSPATPMSTIRVAITEDRPTNPADVNETASDCFADVSIASTSYAGVKCSRSGTRQRTNAHGNVTYDVASYSLDWGWYHAVGPTGSCVNTTFRNDSLAPAHVAWPQRPASAGAPWSNCQQVCTGSTVPAYAVYTECSGQYNLGLTSLGFNNAEPNSPVTLTASSCPAAGGSGAGGSGAGGSGAGGSGAGGSGAGSAGGSGAGSAGSAGSGSTSGAAAVVASAAAVVAGVVAALA